MRRLFPIPAIVALFGALVLVAPARPASAQAASIESELLSLVNSVRSSRVVAHSGLRVAARSHSQAMAARGGLTHSGARSRIANASPDPAESNGAPDDGYTGTWCENTGYVSGAPPGEIAERIHRGWQRSASHRACVADAEMTVAGIGLHFDGETWWATMEAMKDTSLPGSAAPEVASQTPQPVLEQPAPTPSPGQARSTVEPSAPLVTASPPPSTTDPGPTPEATIEAIARASDNRPESRLGWPEALAGLGIALVAALAFRRLGRGAAGNGTT